MHVDFTAMDNIKFFKYLDETSQVKTLSLIF